MEAPTSFRSRKRKRFYPERKFNAGDLVEFRTDEEGFLGSWNPGRVISCKIGYRVVRSYYLLSNDDKLYTESIKVAGVFDGIMDDSPVDRGRIRPPPSTVEVEINDLHYGLCVDCYVNDAWWEGVVFDDNDGLDCREIFFPDMGYVAEVNIKDIRITFDWDVFTEEWKRRGDWFFLEIIQKCELESVIPVSIKQIWSDIRVRKEFGELGDWCCPKNVPLWELLIDEIINEYLTLTVEQFLVSFCPLEANSAETNPFLVQDVVPQIENDLQEEEEVCGSERDVIPHIDDDIQKEEAIRGSKQDVVPRIDDDLQKEKEFFGNEQDVVLHIDDDLQEEEEIYGSKQPITPSTGPASSILNRVVKSKFGGRFKRHIKLRDGSSKPVCKWKWKQCIHDPEFCPHSVDDFSKSKRPTSDVMNKLRQHVMSLRWTVDSASFRGSSRFRYTSPEGKVLYSARELVALLKSEGENAPNVAEDSHIVMVTSPRIPNSRAVKSLPTVDNGQTSIVRSSRNLDLIAFPDIPVKRKRTGKRKKRQTVSEISVPCNEGWEVLIGDQQTVSESSLGLWNQRGAEIKNCKRKRKTLSMMKSLSKGHRPTRSSKRVRQTEPSAQHPLTILSWLIDNNAVVPRSKVYYREENSLVPLGKGRITSKGITCNCCTKLFSPTRFQAHVAGNSSSCRPVENLFLEGGNSLMRCQIELMQLKLTNLSREPLEQDKAKGPRPKSWSDRICSICHYGGQLLLCDRCPSAFHIQCLKLQDIPEGDWFCPSCCCGVCGQGQFDMNKERLSDDCLLVCHQCERRYHARCKEDENINLRENWFCCKSCEMTHWGLEQLLGKPIVVGPDNLTWTLVKPMQYQVHDHEDCDLVAMAENYSKISLALEVIHECFEPLKGTRTRRDLFEDVLFCRGSNMNRLNFKGFYTVLLERNDELITVALLRVYGDKVAEIPLIGTRVQHRRLGMCRVLLNEIEKTLLRLGVRRLVLPAASSVLKTWTKAFGFSRFKKTHRFEFLGYTFLEFQGTTMCQKVLKEPSPPNLSRDISGVVHNQPHRAIEGSNNVPGHEGNISVSGVSQEDRRQGSETVEQVTQTNGPQDKPDDSDNQPDIPSATVTATATVLTNKESEPPSRSSDSLVSKKTEREKNGFSNFLFRQKAEHKKYGTSLQFYTRKKAVEPRPPPLKATTATSK